MSDFKRVYKASATGKPATGGSGMASRDSIEEFVAFFYEFVRDDAALVRVLDRVLKARYGNSETRG